MSDLDDTYDGATNRQRRAFLRAVGGAATASGVAGATGVTEAARAASAKAEAEDAGLTHCVASGDVTDSTAIVWARAADAGTISVEYDEDENFTNPRRAMVSVDSESDHAGHARLTGLRSATRYYYRVWADEGAGATDVPETAPVGTFVTAPKRTEETAVRFAWSGDTYGYGSDPVEPPFPGLTTIAEMQPDFFLYLGDLIYADAKTPAVPEPPSDSLEDYRAKYREMRETNLSDLLPATSTYVMWDDHEVINNFAGSVEPLMPVGRRALFEYWPIDRHSSVTGTDENRLYRSFRWGKHLELFILDTRQYRDPNTNADVKTALGEEQLAWLKDSLADSDATFKLIASPAPIGRPSDTWTTTEEDTGYEDELRDLLFHVDAEGVENVVVVAGDVHHAQVSAYDPNDDGELEVYEAIAGPLGAGRGSPAELYPPLHPTTFYAEGGFFNFGAVEVDERGESLTVEIYAEDGTRHFAKTIGADDRTGEIPDRAESTFDEDGDGWLVVRNGRSNVPEYHAEGGTSGGCIGDAEGQGGVTWYYKAPFEFLGDKSACYGGTLSFDLRQERTDDQFDAGDELQDVVLRSGETEIVYDFGETEANPGEEWTSYELDLTAEAEWIHTESEEPQATEEELRAVLSDLDDVLIRGEYRSGADGSMLDNVVLAPSE